MVRSMIEMIDVLDEHGAMTGVAKTKQEILQAGDWRKVVHIWVVNAAGRLLIQQRAVGRGIFDGLWDVSVGGGVASGEACIDAAVRELEEELGIQCLPNELQKLGTWKMPPKIVSDCKVMKDFSDTYYLRSEIELGKLVLQTREVAAADTIALTEFRESIQIPSTAELWVPHGSEYYVGVTDKILDLL